MRPALKFIKKKSKTEHNKKGKKSTKVKIGKNVYPPEETSVVFDPAENKDPRKEKVKAIEGWKDMFCSVGPTEKHFICASRAGSAQM